MPDGAQAGSRRTAARREVVFATVVGRLVLASVPIETIFEWIDQEVEKAGGEWIKARPAIEARIANLRRRVG